MKRICCYKSCKGKTFTKDLGITLLAFLLLISIAGASPFAYITNGDSNNVSVIDVSTNKVTASVSVGSNPMGVAVSPNGTRVYVANLGTNNVSIIDTATNTVIATVPVGSSPQGIAVSPDGNLVFVANHLSNTVSLLDTSTNNIKTTVNVGKNPAGIAISLDGKNVYVTNEGDNTVSVIDTTTNAVTAIMPVGSDPKEVAVTPDGTKIYVANHDSGSVSVIDVATNRVIDTVIVGRAPFGVAVNPSGTKVFVTSNDPCFSTVSVIDTASDIVTSTIPVGSDPMGIAFTPDGSKAYVAIHSSNTVSEIDTANNTIAATMTVGKSPCAFGQFIGSVPEHPVYPLANFSNNITSDYAFISEPVQFTDLSTNATGWSWNFGDESNSTDQNPTHVYSAAGIYTVSLTVNNSNGTDSKIATVNVVTKGSLTPAYAYITNFNSNSVTVINTGNNNFTRTVPVGTGPEGVAVSPDGTRAYVANSNYGGTGTVSVIDTAINEVTATVPVGYKFSPIGAAVSPDGTKVYVADRDINGVSVIDTATSSVIATVPVGTTPMGISVDPSGKAVYVANCGSNTVSVIDTAINTVTATVNVGLGPCGIAVNPSGTNVYVTNGANNTVSIIDTETNNVAATVNVSSYPFGVAVSPDGTKAYVANNLNNCITVIDNATNNVTASVAVGNSPYGVAVTPDGTEVYVANYKSNSVSVIDTKTNKVTATIPEIFNPLAFGQFIGPLPAQPVLPVANFSSNISSGFVPLTIQFTDYSKNSTQWNWNFGDGTGSTDQSPIHTYSKAGNYSVNLTVSNPNGTDSKSATINVLALPEFSASQTSGRTPLTVSFTDQSTGSPTSWAWDFGDGTNSTEQNPVHIYSKAGKYSVTLTLNETGTACAVTKSSFIFVSNGFEAPVAAFSASSLSGGAPFTVSFTDQSTGSPTSWKWTFGDGTYTTEQNPEHTYNKAGLYSITLTVSNENGNNVLTKSGYIAVSSVSDTPVTNFSASPTSGSEPLTVAFADLCTGSPDSFKWNFGDGNTSNETSPIHTFNKSGLYPITLTASNENGNNALTKSRYIAVTSVSSAPVASFSASPTSGSVPLNVSFTDQSIGSPTSWKWDFGDGNTSKDQNSVHTYNKTGLYSVTLTASNANGSNALTRTAYIAVSNVSDAPVTSFSASHTSGIGPLTVDFTDQSIGSPTSWKWIFGDGNTSNETNPVHTYNKTGLYSVTLTTTNNWGSDTVQRSGFINVSFENSSVISNPDYIVPATAFQTTETLGSVPFTVNFTDQSTGLPTAWKWEFGDGIISNETNPVHTYNKTGLYSVTLTASNANGSNSLKKTAYISVMGSSDIPDTGFSASPTSGNTPLAVSFTDQSTGSPTAWKWTFGDGNTSTEQNPVHIFNKTGLFSVTLTASNANGSNALTKTNYVAVSGISNIPVAGFSASPTSGSAPLTVGFSDKSTGSPTSWVWNFGDGNTSKDQNPVHTYNKTGLNSVTLTANNANGSNVLTKTNYIAISGISIVPVAGFSASNTSGGVPLNVSFTDQSTGSPTSWLWNFGDGNTSKDQNPVHTFNKSGLYSVSLTANNANGSNVLTKSGYIAVSNSLVAAFSATPTSGTAKLSVNFTDRSFGSATSWKWTFGDGNTSNETSPVHVFNKTGQYTVSLTVNNLESSSTETRSKYIAVSK